MLMYFFLFYIIHISYTINLFFFIENKITNIQACIKPKETNLTVPIRSNNELKPNSLGTIIELT